LNQAVDGLVVSERSSSIPCEQGGLLDRILGGKPVVKDEGRESIGVVDPSEEQPPDSIVRGHGHCGLVDHAVALGIRFRPVAMMDERAGATVRSPITESNIPLGQVTFRNPERRSSAATPAGP
jgi:hypothetical protein